jgi:hypothetical protein
MLKKNGMITHSMSFCLVAGAVPAKKYAHTYPSTAHDNVVSRLTRKVILKTLR